MSVMVRAESRRENKHQGLRYVYVLEGNDMMPRRSIIAVIVTIPSETSHHCSQIHDEH